jgi:hypothetical protein
MNNVEVYLRYESSMLVFFMTQKNPLPRKFSKFMCLDMIFRVQEGRRTVIY